jgi:hypothetical protein
VKAVYFYRGSLVFVLDIDELTAAADRLQLPDAAPP